MSTISLIQAGYFVANIVIAVRMIVLLRADKTDDAFGTPMRHRWDIPMVCLLLGLPLWAFFTSMDAIDWMWKKLIP